MVRTWVAVVGVGVVMAEFIYMQTGKAPIVRKVDNEVEKHVYRRIILVDGKVQLRGKRGLKLVKCTKCNAVWSSRRRWLIRCPICGHLHLWHSK